MQPKLPVPSRLHGTEGHYHPCRQCPLRQQGQCSVTVSGGLPVNGELPVSFSVNGPRQTICRRDDPSPEVLVVCSGWACRYQTLPDGQRQITEFLLPGQMVMIAGPFRTRYSASVQTLTTVRTARLDRASMVNLLIRQPALLQHIAQSCVDDADVLEQRLADLGRCSALTRIARLMAGLIDRLTERGMLDGDRCAFPVRHEQLADATGLTSIHVGRKLRQLRDNKVLELSRGQLQIWDRPRLRHIAQLTERN